MEYLIDENKFLLAIDRGETFLTSYRTVTSNRLGGEIFFKQEFSYKFDIEFVKTNKEKLIKLGILIIKKGD